MAIIKKYDALGSTSSLDLVGESGFLPWANFVPHGLSNPDDDYEITNITDDGSTLDMHFYADGSFLGSQQYDYQNLGSDLLYTDARFYSSEGVLLESWSELNQLASELIASSSLAVLESEDRVEGNNYSNYLQGAVGDDFLIGLGGVDRLDGGRADDTLFGGAGDDLLYGGLGTDVAVFSKSWEKYELFQNSDGSIRVKDLSTSNNEGVDTLFDIEHLLFGYQTSQETSISVTQALYHSDSTLQSWDYYYPTEVFNGSNAIYIANGDKYTFGHPTNQIISWAMADNGSYQWGDPETHQDLLGDALEEFSRVANVTFEYVGHYSSVSSAQSSGVDFVYSVTNTDAIAYAFFPIYQELGIDERSVYYSSNNYVAQSSQQGFEEFASFVTLHETGHALGLKHPHHPTDWGFDGQSINPY